MSLTDLSWYRKFIWNPKNITILNKGIEVLGLHSWSLDSIVEVELVIFNIKNWFKNVFYIAPYIMKTVLCEPEEGKHCVHNIGSCIKRRYHVCSEHKMHGTTFGKFHFMDLGWKLMFVFTERNSMFWWASCGSHCYTQPFCPKKIIFPVWAYILWLLHNFL